MESQSHLVTHLDRTLANLDTKYLWKLTIPYLNLGTPVLECKYVLKSRDCQGVLKSAVGLDLVNGNFLQSVLACSLKILNWCPLNCLRGWVKNKSLLVLLVPDIILCTSTKSCVSLLDFKDSMWISPSASLRHLFCTF